ncbi:MAG: succinate dehydrogenase, hydrophobic membrane anchor protein [Legionellales bacterium RIFCSPHIGHO2_12_FULL_37_14]|nr:MAG: succinate dehydrogenase, hydrophobic membrane anchor protein [Legionellales bacterium RIFCSPHIGHO2_12_FULL_37_14]
MVTNVTSLTGSGLKDWLIQRATAVFLLIYTLFAITFFITHPKVDFPEWQLVFHCRCVQIATILAVVAILLHAYIGIWTVLTDYVKCKWLRLSLLSIVAFTLFAEGLWTFLLVWGQ